MSGIQVHSSGCVCKKEGICYDNVDQIKRPESRAELCAD